MLFNLICAIKAVFTPELYKLSGNPTKKIRVEKGRDDCSLR